MSQSTEHQDGNAQDYAAMIKVGDAVETPDGALWVVHSQGGAWWGLTSAYRGVTDGEIHIDSDDEATHTAVTENWITKVADARQVRR